MSVGILNQCVDLFDDDDDGGDDVVMLTMVHASITTFDELEVVSIILLNHTS